VKRRRRHIISISLVGFLLVALLGSVFAFGLKPKLGLDLRGGLSVTLTAPEGTQTDLLDQAVEVLRNRVDSAGVAEPEITREGSNNIFIQLPGTNDPQRLLSLIGRTAQLQFRQVRRVIPKSAPEFKALKVSTADTKDKELVFFDKKKENKVVVGPAEVTGDAVRRASSRPGDNGGWEVVVSFKSDGSKIWAKFTGRLACEQGVTREIAIVLDGVVEGHPAVNQEIGCNVGITGGTTLITGDFSDQEAKDLALVLTAGALPVKLEQSEVRTVSPTLGRDSLRAGMLAGLVGLVLVMLFVLIYYRTLGLQTWLGLGVFSGFIYGLVVMFGVVIGWNLTLAGIAGLIVSIGIATDSYIVFFERIKEEFHEGKSLRTSIDRGFQHAWRTMKAANMVTILAAIVLYLLAVGPVRGFALALGVATCLDLALTFGLTWPLAAVLAENKFFAENPIMGMKRALEGGGRQGSLIRKIYRSEFNIDFIGRRKLWLAISAAFVLISVASLLPSVKGLNYAIDFRGGTIYRAPASRSLTVHQVQEGVKNTGLTNPVVQILRDRTTGKAQVQVQTSATLPPAERDKVSEAIAKVTGAGVKDVATEAVGAKWGAQITTKALRGLIIFLVLVILYMSFRLEPKMAAAGMVALLHDLAITAGVYALVGFEVAPATVIATLTILGYSLYDTVVIFDKIHENQSMPVHSRKSFSEIANHSLNQVLMRSISTSLTVLLPVGSLLLVGASVLGADTLKDLALALFVGVATGTYSSIFLATPLLSIWKQNEARYTTARGRSGRPVPALQTAAGGGNSRAGSGRSSTYRPGGKPAVKAGAAASRAKAVKPLDPEDVDDNFGDEPLDEVDKHFDRPVEPARTAPRPAGAKTAPRKRQSRAKRKGKR
jgi:SecD/SecF fusion protein